MNNTNKLSDEQLLDYVLELADEAICARIAQSWDAQQAAQRMAAEIAPLRELLVRAACPTVEMLVAYGEQRMGQTEQLVLHRHVMACPLCQDELATIAAIHAIPLEMGGPLSLFDWLRSLVHAVGRTEVALGVLGSDTFYETPDQVVSLRSDPHPEHPTVWQVAGEVRTPSHLLACGQLEAVRMHAANTPHAPIVAGSVEQGCVFVGEPLSAGHYQISLLLVDTEVIIPTMAVGCAT